MFDFFIALFGGIFHARKSLSESSKELEFDKLMLEAQRRRESFESYAIYKGSQGYFYDEYVKLYGTYSWRNQMRKDLDSELCKIFGDGYKGRKFNQFDLTPIDFPTAFYLYDKKEQEWAYHLYLSQRGLVDSFAHLIGYSIGGINTFQRDIDICRRIETNLNKVFTESGQPPVRLVQVPKDNHTDWTIYGSKLKFEHTLTTKFPRRRLW